MCTRPQAKRKCQRTLCETVEEQTDLAFFCVRRMYFARVQRIFYEAMEQRTSNQHQL